MTHYMEFELENGETIIMEMDEMPHPPSATADVAMGGELVEASLADEGNLPKVVVKANRTFNQALSQIRNSANLIVTRLRDLSDPPDEVEVTFGLKASGEVGNIIVAKGALEANYTVTLKWKKS